MNRFINPIVKQFFKDRGVTANEELYALSELLQWIFRSQIRDGKPIDLYLPSRRMREILETWLESDTNSDNLSFRDYLASSSPLDIKLPNENIDIEATTEF